MTRDFRNFRPGAKARGLFLPEGCHAQRKGLSAVWLVGTQVSLRALRGGLDEVAKAFRPFGWWGLNSAPRD